MAYLRTLMMRIPKHHDLCRLIPENRTRALLLQCSPSRSSLLLALHRQHARGPDWRNAARKDPPVRFRPPHIAAIHHSAGSARPDPVPCLSGPVISLLKKVGLLPFSHSVEPHTAHHGDVGAASQAV